MSEEFEEIAHAGGKLTFPTANGRKGISFRHATPLPVAVMGYRASVDGRIIRPMPFTGMDTRDPEDIPPEIPVMLISDREGMFGRSCPACKSYFRTDFSGISVVCPYCIRQGSNVQFATENQCAFVRAYVKAALEAIESAEEVVVDLDTIAEGLSANAPGWHYAETAQQRRFRCAQCRTRVDVLGDYASCPSCGTRNWREEFKRRLDELEARLVEADTALTARSDREEEWERLLRCVSEFEGLANDVKRTLRMLPLTPKRRGELDLLSFQNVVSAARALKEWYGFDVVAGLSDEDQRFLTIMFNRRHLFTHNAGRVDQEYLRNTGDSSVALNQRVRLRSRELKRLIPLVRRLGDELLNGVDSLSRG